MRPRSRELQGRGLTRGRLMDGWGVSFGREWLVLGSWATVATTAARRGEVCKKLGQRLQRMIHQMSPSLNRQNFEASQLQTRQSLGQQHQNFKVSNAEDQRHRLDFARHFLHTFEASPQLQAGPIKKSPPQTFAQVTQVGLPCRDPAFPAQRPAAELRWKV